MVQSDLLEGKYPLRDEFCNPVPPENFLGLFRDKDFYDDVRKFVRSVDNVTWLKPKMSYRQVIDKYGYPVVSKKNARFIRDLQNKTNKNFATRNLRLTGYNRKGEYLPSMILPKKWRFLVDAPFKVSEQCCDVMKKEPFSRYVKETNRKSFSGVMASDSNRRNQLAKMF